MFYLNGSPEDALRLKSFSSRSNSSGKSTVSITLETNDPYQLAYALEGLAKVQQGQKRAAACAARTPRRERKRAIEKPARLLQLPAPEEQ